MRRNGLRWALAGALALGCRGGPAPRPDAAAPRVEPSLAPKPTWAPAFPPAARIVERFTQRRTESSAEQVLFQQQLTLTGSTRFESLPGGQVQMTQQVEEVTVDPPLPAAAAASLIARAPLRALLSADGVFLRLLEPEAFLRAVREGASDPGGREALARALTPEALEGQARREWETRSGALLRRRLEEGGAVDTVESVTLSSGEVLAYGVERTLQGTRQTGRGQALVYAIACFSQADPAHPGRQEAIEAARELLGSGGRLAPGATCSGEQVVALSPFAPVSLQLTLTLRPVRAGQPPGELRVEESRSTLSQE